MSFSRLSRAVVPCPEKCNRFAIPFSVGVLELLSPVPGAGAGAGDRAGTAPGCDRIGSPREGIAPDCVGDAAGAFAGELNSSESPSMKANCPLSARRGRSRPYMALVWDRNIWKTIECYSMFIKQITTYYEHRVIYIRPPFQISPKNKNSLNHKVDGNITYQSLRLRLPEVPTPHKTHKHNLPSL